MVQGGLKVPGGYKYPTPAPTFRVYGYRTFVVCQYNYRMCWYYRRNSSSKSLSI